MLRAEHLLTCVWLPPPPFDVQCFTWTPHYSLPRRALDKNDKPGSPAIIHPLDSSTHYIIPINSRIRAARECGRVRKTVRVVLALSL